MAQVKTCEYVSPKHPDKLCDFIADSVLDAFLAQDPKSRVAVEVMGGHKHITVSGEITSHASVDMAAIVQAIVGEEYKVTLHVSQQSPFIAQGVDIGGAGDQGIMIGYATNETEHLMPKEYELARNLCQSIYAKYPRDGKVQVTLDGDVVDSVVASFQNTKTKELESVVRTFINARHYYINAAGEWEMGGFDADTGLTGRKTVVDSYGPEVPIGGGSFSGKDPTKVDRSGAYMARKIAVDLLKQNSAKEVLVKLAYVIGKKEPVMAVAFADGREVEIPKSYDLTPRGIISRFDLLRPMYANISSGGHFGRGFPWDL